MRRDRSLAIITSKIFVSSVRIVKRYTFPSVVRDEDTDEKVTPIMVRDKLAL